VWFVVDIQKINAMRELKFWVGADEKYIRMVQ
jgi:hypothetical protein